ncbi:MAG: 50S ribosomal protein L34 [Candidatus Goldiibacteriota bacterium HGW-Goldbacteria-1]|jgi:large subunit ribosomal protein L34|nr:MAG: 50S ribosomal protein L34 [Candidatus Goldiibacteriota bacterium HGW-Goldbacteria-1]
MPKRTFQPHKKKAQRKHGFLKRMSTPTGRKAVNRRRAKGRTKMTSCTK